MLSEKVNQVIRLIADLDIADEVIALMKDTQGDPNIELIVEYIKDGLYKMKEDGMDKLMYDTKQFDLTLKKDRNTGLDTDNIQILISPR